MRMHAPYSRIVPLSSASYHTDLRKQYGQYDHRQNFTSIQLRFASMAVENPVGLEFLPQELLDAVVDRLDELDTTRLMSCSRHLKRRLEPVLYSSSAIQEKAIRWACRSGEPATVRLAVRYGASVDMSWGDTSIIEQAARKHHGGVIRTVLKLSAHILSPDITDKKLRHRRLDQFRRIVRSLCSPHMHLKESSSLIALLYDVAIDERSRKADPGPDTAIPLNTLILSGAGAPLGLIRRVIDDGADINKPRSYKRRDSLSPLSASVISNSEQVFNLLLEREADIHGTAVDFFPKTGLHIPIFAAASTMATAEHGRTMVQLCLDRGADINRRILIMAPSDELRIQIDSWYPDRYSETKRFGKTQFTFHRYTYATPLMIFIDSIESFRPFCFPDPVSGLT